MNTAKFLSEFAKQFSDSLPPSLKALHQEFEQQFQQGLKAAFEKLDLVTREEFEIQMTLLARLQEKVQQLESRIAELETKGKKSTVQP